MFFSSKHITNPSEFPFVITGCDSGFGYLTAITLASQGFPVFAGCLTLQGKQNLDSKKIDHLKSMKLNVCIQEDVDAFVRFVKSHAPEGVYCLINNAGIADGTFLELSSMESWERTIQVNLIGAMRMAKALIPLLRDFGRGSRIINISSAASFACLPGMTSYSASKSAIRMAGDALRFELAPFGIHVTSIMPGFFKTAIVESPKRAIDQYKKAPAHIQQVYGPEFIPAVLKQFDMSIGYAPDPQICVNEIVKVAKSKSPPTDRPVGYDSWILWYTLFLVPNWIKVFIVSIVMRATWAKLNWKPKQD